jgi:hypothetical protein
VGIKLSALSKKSLTRFEDWEKPTLDDVLTVFEKLDLADEQFTNISGIDARTVRRWTLKRTEDRKQKSTIPYVVWCILIVLSENKFIFADIKKRDLSKVPNQYICSFDEFVSPPKEVLTQFVGRQSITGLTRTELASIFGWHPTYLGKEFNRGKITFLNWVIILLFCGVNINILIKMKKNIDKIGAVSKPVLSEAEKKEQWLEQATNAFTQLMKSEADTIFDSNLFGDQAGNVICGLDVSLDQVDDPKLRRIMASRLKILGYKWDLEKRYWKSKK